MTTYSYESILQRASKVNWQIEDIINDQKKLNFSQRFLPETLAQVEKISCLNEGEKLLLNQIRGNSYLHIFGLAEEFVVPTVINHVAQTGLEDITASQALLHFAEEESKHINLFRRFAAEFEEGFGSQCGVIGPVEDIVKAVMQHHPLGVILAILYIEWMTQYHYLETVRDNHRDNLDPQFCSLLKHHWLEEAQHAQLDTLMVKQLVNTLDNESINQGVEDFFKIVELLNGGFMMQVQLDMESLSDVTGRIFSESEIEEITSIQQKSYQWTLIGSGLTHRNVLQTFQELIPDQIERLTTFSQQYC
ncbi:MAG: hypothetical protein AB4058_17570 [Microcystaceae cyanobacterium]